MKSHLRSRSHQEKIRKEEAAPAHVIDTITTIIQEEMAIQEESHPEKEGMRKTIIVVGDLNLVQTLTQEGPNQEREDTDTETQGLPQEKEDIMEEEEENRLQEDSIEIKNVIMNLDLVMNSLKILIWFATLLVSQQNSMSIWFGIF